MTTLHRSAASAALLLGLAMPAVASQSGPVTTSSVSKSRTLNRAEVGGIVTGQMITLAGRTFYDSFAAAWRDKDEQGRFVVAISERPSARWGSQVFVDYGNRRLYQAFLPPNLSRIGAIGTAAAEQVFQAIIDDQVAQFFGDPDMARDEF
ncbi:CsgE family curli-type amyloid fiber assembly protein [Cupriavidus numazuensis]|uniref:Curli production assembly/transport component CsgE n=1 Tax=Cupriavidus numazuensis TaxID=221992 RepID=A0ABN7Q786_9BURK|nr:CsgE family curli-type amyloid fiber assembly protein [Cupriavidus numazuensis]CAG2153005.1 hypothetical protein LMG26411_04320 [Cupriavidus numazuensis]